MIKHFTPILSLLILLVIAQLTACRPWAGGDEQELLVPRIDGDWNRICLAKSLDGKIFEHEGQWYIAALAPDLDGIRLAKLQWVIASDPDE